jgi:hypothetical protein
MRESPFSETVRLLFDRLDLDAPRFDDTGIVRLRVEDVGVNLSDGGTGHLVIEGQVGPLPDDPARRGEAVRQVLRTAAGMILTGEAGTFSRSFPGGKDMLSVQASYPYGTNDLDRLVAKIEDAIYLIEVHGAALSGTGRKPAPAERRDRGPEDAVIFRP